MYLVVFAFLLLSFSIYTFFPTDTVTHLVTSYGSTHDALEFCYTMSDMEALFAIAQTLLTTVESQATNMQKSSVLEIFTKREIVESPVDSAEFVGTDVVSGTTTQSLAPVQPSRSAPSSTLRDIGKNIPLLTGKEYSLRCTFSLMQEQPATGMMQTY